jgi:16S rRNA (cytosine967-C5)-methyltransferase
MDSRQQHIRRTDPMRRRRSPRPQTEAVSGNVSTFDIFDIAEEVVRRSDREHPADAVLRERLRSARGISRVEAAEISRLVFTFYRWRGWLANEKGTRRRMERALEFAHRFQENPFSLPVESLRSKAVPEWTAGEVQASDEWFRSLQREPVLWLRARPGQGRTLAKKLGKARQRDLPDAVLYEGTDDLFRTSEFHEGEFEVQDISSQAVGHLCAPQPGETWWDACAGEGGKTLHLSDLMQNKGLIWASDRAEWRLQRLKRRAARAKVFNYRAVSWDGGPRLPTKTVFDGVLVDAPCSGVGTWQRNPHARWTTTELDVKELAAIQKQLLSNAAQSVKPGGKLIYSVCTLTRSETVGVVEVFEREHQGFEAMAMANPLAPDLPASSRLWLWPQNCGGNGMFIAAWRRVA